MNRDQHCNHCQKVTETKEWDCTICGLSKPYLPKVYTCGDTHGGHDMRKLNSKNWKEGKTLTKSDFLIQLGDFGCLWYPHGSQKQKKDDHHWQRWLNNKKWTTLFIDGNHENHDQLAELPEVEMFGGMVGKVSDSIYHLKRGYVYNYK